MQIKLFLGDHAFHSLYGKKLEDKRVRELMCYAAKHGITGVAAGEERMLHLAADVRQNYPNIKIIYHTDIEFEGTTGGHRVRSDVYTAGAGLREEIIRRNAHNEILRDKITGKFLTLCDNSVKLDINNKGGISWYYSNKTAEYNLTLMEMYKPDCVTIGGDVLDCAVYQGMNDALTLTVREFLSSVHAYVSDCRLTSYLLPVADYSAIDDLFDGYLAPYNALGGGMLPNPTTAEWWLRKQKKPIIAMHLLHGGKIHPYTAFFDAQVAGFISGAVIGASSEKHIDSILAASERWA